MIMCRGRVGGAKRMSHDKLGQDAHGMSFECQSALGIHVEDPSHCSTTPTQKEKGGDLLSSTWGEHVSKSQSESWVMAFDSVGYRITSTKVPGSTATWL